MIPENRFSTENVQSLLVLPNPQPSVLESRQYGGAALNDASAGLSTQIWTGTLVGNDVVFTPEIGPAVIVFSRPGITELCIAFDQNMHPFVTFVEGGQAKYWWWDTTVAAQVFSDLPVGSTTPRCTLDDHRVTQNATSDIILTYIDDGNLYFRMQRDRYLIQYLLYPDINLTIISPEIQYIAMDVNWRVQFKINGNFYDA